MQDKPRKSDPFDPERHVLVDTSYGRAHLPEVLQASLGEKSIVGFDRYDRVVGAVVPIEAVRILAGFSDQVDPDVRERVRRSALKLLMSSAPERRRLGDIDPLAEAPPVSVEQLAKERAQLRGRRRREP